MAAIFFADLDALRLALASGSVPPTVGRAPARAGFDAQGRLWLQPSAPLAREVASALTRLGAAVQGTAGIELTEVVDCWPQVLPLQPAMFDPQARLTDAVLFDLPDAAQLPRLVAELRRFGAGNIVVRWIEGREATRKRERPAEEKTPVAPAPGLPLVLVESPPFFSMLRALDRGTTSPRAFVQQAPRVWVEVGYRHPLAEQIEPPAGQIALLTAPRGWEFLDDGPFRAGPEQFDLPRGLAAGTDTPDDARIPLTLRLIPGASDEPAELWVITDQPLERLQALAEQCDDRLIARLQFAIGYASGRQIALLRVRPGKGAPPALVLEALACRPYLRLPNLFVPVGQRLRPPLRRDAVRQLLADDGDVVSWLEPHDDGRFDRHAVPVSAFQPLDGFIAYRVERRPESVTVPPLESPFGLSPFTVQDLRPASRRPARPPANPAVAPPAPVPAAKEPVSWWQRFVGRLFTGHRSEDEGRSLLPVGRVGPVPGPAATAETPRSTNDAEERRRTLERRFLAATNTVEDTDRWTQWSDLATLYAAQNRPADAAICWLNALWDDDTPQPLWARGWLRAETQAAHGPASEADIERWLTGTPTPAAVRVAAAYTVWSATQTAAPSARVSGPPDALRRVQRLLEDHEHWLPVRAAWLARLALAHLTKGDVVGLARTRDRLLERLHERGLSVDLDVPTFLRFAGQASGEQVESVREWLLHAHEPIHRWIAARPNRPDLPGSEVLTAHDPHLRTFGLTTDLRATRAYADLILAWGLARLGERAICQELLGQARTVLAGADEAHAFLLEAYSYRVRQALEGRAEAGSLPPELLTRLEAMKGSAATGARETLLSFKVERLLEHSRILEPVERVDPYRDGVLGRFGDDLQQSLAAVRAVRDRDELARRLNQILTTVGRDPDRLPRALAEALNLAPRVGESFATGVLDRLLATAGGFSFAGRPEQVDIQVLVLERGLFVAAHFDHTEAVQRLVGYLSRLFDPRRAGDTAAGQSHAEDALLALIGQSLRGLRRLGLRSEADLLLTQLGEWVAPGGDLAAARQRRPQDWPKTLRRLLALAGGWFYVGRDAPATATLDEARRLLFAHELRSPDQTGLACAYAGALGHAPVQLALGRVTELFQRLHGVSDTLSTNTHFSLARLRLVEAAVRAVVNDDFALGPAVRRWLDDDEYRVRRRIHRDTRAMVGPGV